jgi:hypothetical protein
LKVLHDEKFPKKRVLAGLNWSNTIVQGMLMVFSKDVLVNMLRDHRIYSKQIMQDNDDVSLSVIADPYSKWIDWNIHSCWYQRECPIDEKGKYQLDKIKPDKNNIWVFRICHHESNRKIDLSNWDQLLKYFHEYEIVSKHQITTSTIVPLQKQEFPCHWCVWLGLLFLLVLVVVVIMRKKKKLNK